MSADKNLLLINPWIHDFTAYDFWTKPLGLLYVAGLLRKCTEYKIRFIDCLDRRHPLLDRALKIRNDGRGPYPKQEIPKPAVLKEIPRKFSRYGVPPHLIRHQLEHSPIPDAVLITGIMTYWYTGIQEAMGLVREVFGNIPVILGGVYPTLCPEHARSLGADAVVEGSAADEILRVLGSVLGTGFSDVPHNHGLDDWPGPAYDLLPSPDSLPVLTSRGCPFHCPYCAGPLLNTRFERRDPDSVVEEIAAAVRDLRVPHIAFYDDALLLGKRLHLFPILRRLTELCLPVAFHTPNGLHIREIDRETAVLFRRSNVRSLYLSQESFDPVVMDDSSKVGGEDLSRALVCLEEAGYRRADVNVYLLVGLPGQAPEGIVESIRRVKALGARPRLSYFSPVPGTETWRRLVRERRIGEGDDPLLHNKLAFAYISGEMSSEDFRRIRTVLDERTS